MAVQGIPPGFPDGLESSGPQDSDMSGQRAAWLNERRQMSRPPPTKLPSSGDEKVAPLVRQLPWTHNLIILGQSKSPEEREFYVRLAIQEHWSRRELERQLKGALFERAVLTPAKVSSLVRQMDASVSSIFKDAYMLEFLELPAGHDEADLHRAVLLKLKDFLIELGRDFRLVGSESWAI